MSIASTFQPRGPDRPEQNHHQAPPQPTPTEQRFLKALHWMRCPKCGLPLTPERHSSLEFDLCPTCHGVWLDAPALQALTLPENDFLRSCLWNHPRPASASPSLEEFAANTSLPESLSNAAHTTLPLREAVALQHLLVPTDFSETSSAGVDYAVKLAGQFGAALTLVHVLEPVPPLPGVEALLLPTEPQIAVAAHTRLAALAQQHAVKDLRLSTSLLTGKPFHAIILAAAEQATDLIVMATHGYTGFDHLLLGSTAEHVARHAPCSVLIVPAHPELAPPSQRLKLTRLLVPIDFSGFSELALPWAVTFARAFGAELLLFHAVEKYPLDYLMGPELMNHAITPLLKEAEAALERLADHVRASTGIQTSALVRDGTPYKEICQAAQDHHADLIALTTHGYTGLKHVWLGSTAERVARHASCPVLIVREPKTPPTHAPIEAARESYYEIPSAIEQCAPPGGG